MIKFFTTLFVSFILISGLTSAQSINQSPQNNLQQQGSSTQNTRNVQSSGSIVPEDNSASTLSEAQPESLGVVGNPNQEKPSVSVGRSGSTEATNKESDTSRWVGGTVVIAILGMLAYLYSRKVRRDIAQPTETDSASETSAVAVKTTAKKPTTKKAVSQETKIDDPSTDKEPPKATPKKKKSTKSSKKKRGKNHR